MSAFLAGVLPMRLEAQFARRKELSGNDVLVLSVTFGFAADGEQEPLAWPSVARIAARARIDPSTVKRSHIHLEEVGAITGQHRHRKPTIWSLHPSLRKGRSGEEPAGSTSVDQPNQLESGVTLTPDIGHTDPSHRSPRPKRGVTVTSQVTELCRRPVPEHSSENGSPAGSGSSASLPETAPSGSPEAPDDPRLWFAGPPPGTVVYLDGVAIGTAP